jgi:hypothetical protein
MSKSETNVESVILSPTEFVEALGYRIPVYPYLLVQERLELEQATAERVASRMSANRPFVQPFDMDDWAFLAALLNEDPDSPAAEVGRRAENTLRALPDLIEYVRGLEKAMERGSYRDAPKFGDLLTICVFIRSRLGEEVYPDDYMKSPYSRADANAVTEACRALLKPFTDELRESMEERMGKAQGDAPEKKQKKRKKPK